MQFPELCFLSVRIPYQSFLYHMFPYYLSCDRISRCSVLQCKFISLLFILTMGALLCEVKKKKSALFGSSLKTAYFSDEQELESGHCQLALLHTYTHTHTVMHTHMYTYMIHTWEYIHSHIHLLICTCMHTYTHTHIYTYSHIYMYIYRNTHVLILIHMHKKKVRCVTGQGEGLAVGIIRSPRLSPTHSLSFPISVSLYR